VTTVVAFHAHPDDEVLLTGGTIARLAAESHRVVIVVACDGSMREASDARLAELRASAGILGAARVVHLGYADSGHGPVFFPDPPGRVRFGRADLEEAAGRLADILREERADVLLSYDAAGGNGHRDHVRVHTVGGRAASLVPGIRVLEATVPRELVTGMFRLVALPRLVVRYQVADLRTGFTPRRDIEHLVNVRRYARQKQAALAAHTSQVSGRGRAARLMRVLTRLPVPAFALVCGREWFAEPVRSDLGFP
jgi:LmbE family N-acetylglucosaminyl deacetylase